MRSYEHGVSLETVGTVEYGYCIVVSYLRLWIRLLEEGANVVHGRGLCRWF